MFSKKATKIEEIFTVDLTLYIQCQIDSEDFFNFCGLFRKHVLYDNNFITFNDPYSPISPNEVKLTKIQSVCN